MDKKASTMVMIFVFSIIMGGLIILIFSKMAIIMGDFSEARVNYIVKDSALLLDVFMAMPGNAVVNFYYNLDNRIFFINKTQLTIYNHGESGFSGTNMHYFASYNSSVNLEKKLERPDSLEFFKTDYIGVNEEHDLDALSCVYHYNRSRPVKLVQLIYDHNRHNSFSLQVARQIKTLIDIQINVLKLDVNLLPIVSVSEYYKHENEADIKIIISTDTTNNIKKHNFLAYVPYNNSLANEIACKSINKMILKKDTYEIGNFMVYSIDPELFFMDSLKVNNQQKNLPYDAIYFSLGNIKSGISAHSTSLAKSISDGLIEYIKLKPKKTRQRT